MYQVVVANAKKHKVIAVEMKGTHTLACTCIHTVMLKWSYILLPPAEDTFVGTSQAGCGLHAAMAFNTIKGVLIAATSPSQHGLGPPAHLHSRMRAYNAIA